MIYTEKYTVTWHDTDANRCVRPSQILMYMQETANRHLQAYGCDLDCLRDERGLGFLLSRITLRIYEPLYAYEEIEAQTWICESRGLSFNRCFRILRGETVIAEAFTVWALMDLRARRLVSNEEFIYPFEGEDALALDIPLRFRVPSAEQMEAAGERRIVYSDLDYNGHMNNTRYPDMLCDFTPRIRERRVIGCAISFLHEAAFGKTLSIYRQDSRGECLFRTLDEDGNTCLEARLITEPRKNETKE